MGLLVRLLANTAAIFLAAAVIPGIEVSGLLSALGAGLVLGIVNAVVRPILIFLTLPFTLITLGLFLFVLNAFCLWLTSLLVKGFEVHGFWPALFGSILISLVSWLLTAFLSDRGEIETIAYQRSQSMAALGWLLVIGGLICAGYFFFTFDTSVSTIAGSRVHNVGLMQNRLLGCVAGIAATIIGTVIILFAKRNEA